MIVHVINSLLSGAVLVSMEVKEKVKETGLGRGKAFAMVEGTNCRANANRQMLAYGSRALIDSLERKS